MDLMDFELDNHFDNFVQRRSRRRRRPMPRRQRVREEMDGRRNESSGGDVLGLKNVRSKNRRGHRKVLQKISSPSFFANRNNHKKVLKQVKSMAKDIDQLTTQLIKEKGQAKCSCGSGLKARGKKRKYNNFSGGKQVNDMWSKYKVPLLIGGALAFFLYSPMGKKMIK